MFKNRGSAKKILILCKFSNKFSSNLSISLVQYILVLDKSRKLVSCVRVDYENKTQMLFIPSIQFFIDVWGLLLIGRKGMHYAQLKFTCVLNRRLFSCANYPRKHAEYIQNLLLIKALYFAAFFIVG